MVLAYRFGKADESPARE